QVKEEQLKARGQEMDPDVREKLRAVILDQYEREGSAYYSTARLWDDGIIDPVDTRKIIAMGIAASLNKKFPDTKYGIFRM
ncbi:MAG: methylcrotonoyl-CoA carboxylase, partial [Bacteroidetes bacterium]